MTTALTIGMALIVVMLIVSFIFAVLMRQRLTYPPGPFPWPFVGNHFYLRKLTRVLGGQHLAFLELSKLYNSGVVSLQLGASKVIVISNAKLIQEVLNKEEYDGRPWTEFIKIRNFGMKKGITMNDGPDWKELRAWSIRTLRSIGFAKREMTELITNELKLILERLKDNSVQHIRPAIEPAVINVLWTLVTGKPLHYDLRLKFMNLLNRRMQAFDMAGGLLSAFPWIRYVIPKVSGYKLLVEFNQELKSFLMDIINDHKERYVEGSKADFIDMFLSEIFKHEDKKSIFTDDNLLVTLADFFIAGINTTTATLDFLFLQMANHQNVQQKLHKEIDAVIGSNKFLNLEDRINMPFTEAILTECQRIWLVTPVIGPRRVLCDTTLDGYTIPKNSTILLNIFCNNMNPEFFPNPILFQPERFVKDGVYQPDKNIIIFGKGKRRCPGESLAKTAIFLLFAGVMQRYRLLPIPGKETIEAEIGTGLTIAPKPYEMLIIPR
ncbi:probable cytochrome P450 305a1 [Linepithema humile]|uniref:probable cytochrome P450 305a1 n=1 Tax=Linepithema humile TaxID=83485 RepID=UPI00351F17A7